VRHRSCRARAPPAPPPHPPRAAAPIRGIAASAPRYPCGGHFPCHLFRISLLHATWEGPVHKHSACVAVNPCATSAGTGRLCCIHLQLSPPILKPALHARTSRSLQLIACALPPLRSISRAPPPSRSGDAGIRAASCCHAAACTSIPSSRSSPPLPRFKCLSLPFSPDPPRATQLTAEPLLFSSEHFLSPKENLPAPHSLPSASRIRISRCVTARATGVT